MLLAAFVKTKELDRHGESLADLKVNIETFIGSVGTRMTVLRIADTDAEISRSLRSHWRTPLAVVELCDSCLQRRINAIWPNCQTGYVMPLTILWYVYVTLPVRGRFDTDDLIQAKSSIDQQIQISMLVVRTQIFDVYYYLVTSVATSPSITKESGE